MSNFSDNDLGIIEYYAKPHLIYNDASKRIKVITEIQKNLRDCDSFDFSVAFIKDGGLADLRQTFDNLSSKDVKGRLITSTYLNFNSPKVFRQLLKFKNIETRIYPVDVNGFHPKGYIFKKDDKCRIIVGSSNLTQSALASNQEWNLEVNSFMNEDVTNEIVNEFNNQWDASTLLTSEWIDAYEKIYEEQKQIETNNIQGNVKIVPNAMQKEALCSLESMHNQGVDRALLISATGTGKTYLSAFDVKQFNPKKVLFVVHRETIARKSMEAFKKIMPNKRCGIYTGSEKTNKNDVDFVFATVLTMSKQEHREYFGEKYFDYIIIDEAHHSGAKTYQELIKYFQPKFMLGMTATPERNDGFDIYDMFGHNIAYEIRLQQAMEYNMLCPFHYYGIRDIVLDDELTDDDVDITKLTSIDRAEHILAASRKYGYSGNKIHSLVFVSRVEEAKFLANYFNNKGYNSICLSGEDSQQVKDEAIRRFELETTDEAIDYIFTVDIFNEGVDIPCINQVIMARPTESAIIYVQQLGRGLRKDINKDYLIVIDIIGNYKKAYLIPVALSGDNSGNKDNYRKFIHEGSSLIYGESTIDYDVITKKKIYESIDQANYGEAKVIFESYKELKAKLGKIPRLLDFDNYGAIDPLKIFENSAYGSYHEFLLKKEKDYKVNFKFKEQDLFLEFVSRKLASGKRIQELELIKTVILYENSVFSHFSEILKENYNILLDNNCKDTLVNILEQNFITGTGANTYKSIPFIKKDVNDYCISDIFKKCLEDDNFKSQILEVIDFGINRYTKNYFDRYKNTDLVLYQKYSYEDVCRMLNWEKSLSAQIIGGYRYDEKTKTFPIFINYEKHDVTKSNDYSDHFINERRLVAISKSYRNLESKDVQRIETFKKDNSSIHLFVRKNKDDKEAKEFYYLGLLNRTENSKPIETTIKDTKIPVVEFQYDLESEVREDIYDYIIS